MNVNNFTQCSQEQKPKTIFDFGASSTMVPCNSMRTKNMVGHKDDILSKHGQNGPGAQARAQPHWHVPSWTKAISKVETTNNILQSLSDSSKLVSYYMYHCVVSRGSILPFCTGAHMHAPLTWEPRDYVTQSTSERGALYMIMDFCAP